jgi:hypothetical protein
MADELNPQGSPDEVDYEELRRQLMGGGAGQPAAGAPTGTPAPAPNAEPQPPSVGSIIASAGGPKPLASGIAPATPQPSAIPAPTSNGLPDLISQRAKAGQPIDPRAVDPNTGKPMYKMGLGQRILGTVANAARGYASRGEATPIDVGPGATNARFGRDVQMQKENTENLDTQIGNTEKLNTEQQNLYNSAIKASYEGEVAGAKREAAEAAAGRTQAIQENADTRRQLEASEAARNQSIADKNEKGKTPTNEVELVQAYNAETDPKKKAALKGAIDQLAQLKAAGKDTSTADLAKVIQIHQQKADMIDRVNKEKEGERARKYKEADSNIKLKYNQEALAAEHQKIDNALDAKYEPRFQSASDEADKLLGLTKKGSALQSKPGATPAATPKTKPEIGSTISVDGKPRKVVGWNEKTKKPIVQ